MRRMRAGEPQSRSSLSFDVAGDGPPLILLHGLSGSRRWWARNVPAFAARFRTYTVDLPGFGESRRVPWSRLEGTVHRLLDWFEGEGIARAHLAGHSMGGAVAARLAASFPERVDRLVLVNAAVRPRGAWAAARAGDVVRTLSRTPPGFTPLLARDLLRLHPGSALAAGADMLLADWGSHLSQVTAPTLVVWGEHDVVTPLPLGRAIAASVSGARLVVVPDAGHSPMWEQPEAFNTAVLDFLVSLEERRG
jgi:pimeloyl-ACP methyl ester carboxylesterase